MSTRAERIASQNLEERHHLAQQVSSRRLRREWTREQLAHQAQITAREVENVEDGLENPPLSVLIGLAHALGCPTSELLRPLGRGGKPKPTLEEQALRTTLKKVEKYLTTLVTACETHLRHMEKEMHRPSSPERGGRIARLCNALEFSKDSAKHFGLNLPLTSTRSDSGETSESAKSPPRTRRKTP